MRAASISDISIRELLGIIEERFKIKVEIAPQVGGDIVLIRLTGQTPESAIREIADGAKLSLTVTDAGVYRVGFAAQTPE